MATIAQGQSRSGGGGCIVLILIAGAIIMGFLSLVGGSLGAGAEQSLPALNDHAIQKHGQQAVNAWQYIDSLAIKDFCKWECPDQRTRYVCNIKGSNDWAVAVLEDGHLITSFVTNQEYAKGVIDSAGCGNPWRLSHP